MRNLVDPVMVASKLTWRLSLGVALLPLVTACVVEAPAPRVAAVIRVTAAPPPLPVYEQPPCPEDGYLWTPGYWAYGANDYYWVPGTWVRPPQTGMLWTPGYWGWSDGVYIFHGGYWGSHVGFYGGVAYGGGYTGNGYAGGRWVNNHISYNTAVTHINQTIVHNTYNENVTNVTVNNVTVNNISYNGGPNGTHIAPTAQEQAIEREPHVQPTAQQIQHSNDAQKNPALFAKVNQGKPAIAATPRPSAFSAPGAVPARAVVTPPTSHVGTEPSIPKASPPPAAPIASRPMPAETVAPAPAPPAKEVQAVATAKQQTNAANQTTHAALAAQKPNLNKGNHPANVQKRPAQHDKAKPRDKEHDHHESE